MKQLRRIKKTVDQVKSKPKTPKKNKSVNVNDLAPSPCVPFNLECSGRHEGAFQLGKVVNIIGDSSSGKTLFVLSSFAECTLLERFDKYRLIYDDVEVSNEFDIAELFGQKCFERIETSVDTRSKTIEQFNDRIATLIDQKEPFIYVLDSFDALTSEQSVTLDLKNRKKRAAGNKVDQQYNDGKAAVLTEFFSLRIQELKDSKSLVIIISQTRDNLGFGAMFNPKRRAGGKALKFFSCHEIWLATQKKEKEGRRTYITNVQAKISKNKITGRQGEAFFQILFDYGVDNIASCIKFLMEEGNWTGTKGSINTKGFCPLEEKTKTKKTIGVSYINLVGYIEEKDLENDLALLCQETYDDIMESLKPNRKRKY